MDMQSWSNPDEYLACDACLQGCGAWLEGKYFHCKFPDFTHRLNLHINALELLTVVVSVKLWGTFLRNKKIVINCDNSVSCQVLNSGFTRDPFLQSCLREICFYAALHEFQIKAKLLRGTENRRPDWLSRWDLKPCFKSWFYESVKHITVKEYSVDSSLFHFTHTW